MFDLIGFCEDEGINYKTDGKNVSPGWVNINCPFCDDPSEHLGYDPKSERLNCWRCGKHDLVEMLKELVDVNVYDALKKYRTDDDDIRRPIVERGTEKETPVVEMPPGAYKPTHSQEVKTNPYNNYLINRDFDMGHLVEQWNLWVGGLIGEWKWRIIAPVYHEHTLVSYVGRGIFDNQEPKYLNMHGRNLKNYLYGYDHCKDKVIVVEGITDVWRLGRGHAVATFGTQTTMAQFCLLKKFKKVGVMFDKEPKAQEEAMKIINALSIMGIECENIQLPEGVKDPGELPTAQVREIVKNFF
jgi:hypothetical protein